jgi:hypothetical protein
LLDSPAQRRGRAANRRSRKNSSPLGRLVSALAAVAVLLGGASLLFLEGGRELVPGRCPTGLFGPSTEGVSDETSQLLENPNFEATPAAVRDLRAGVVDSRLVGALRTVAEEHQVCVVAFKEGHRFLPGVEDGPLIPEGYGEAGVLFSKYTHLSSEVPRSVERGGSQGRTIIGVEARPFGYLSRALSLVQPGQT